MVGPAAHSRRASRRTGAAGQETQWPRPAPGLSNDQSTATTHNGAPRRQRRRKQARAQRQRQASLLTHGNQGIVKQQPTRRSQLDDDEDTTSTLRSSRRCWPASEKVIRESSALHKQDGEFVPISYCLARPHFQNRDERGRRGRRSSSGRGIQRHGWYATPR